jgi:hypothetical protein
MESDETPTVRPSPDDVRASLDAVNRVQADLADRLVSPWWYNPGLGLVEAVLVTSMASSTPLRPLPTVFGLAGLGLLVSAYKRRTGLGMSTQYFALTRAWSIALIMVIIAAMLLVFLADRPVVTAAAAMGVFVATVVLGRRADIALRDRLRHGTRTR